MKSAILGAAILAGCGRTELNPQVGTAGGAVDGGGGTVDGASAPLPPGCRVRDVALGAAHTCALTDDGSLWCWGANDLGQIGDGSQSERHAPVRMTTPAMVTHLASGSNHTCAVVADGSLWCWGANVNGELGLGDNRMRATPARVEALGTEAKDVAAGSAHTCALAGDGALWCWGNNPNGEIGADRPDDQFVPRRVDALDEPVAWVRAGGDGTCALSISGTLRCWGPFFGRPSDGRMRPSVPAEVALPRPPAAMAVGYRDACAVEPDGTLWCWGNNDKGQLAMPPSPAVAALSPIAALANSVVAVSAGSRHTCALATSGDIRCWGTNASGQLGNGGETASVAPVRARLPVGAAGVAASPLFVPPTEQHVERGHTCAWAPSGELWCWGENNHGQLATGAVSPRSDPSPVRLCN